MTEFQKVVSLHDHVVEFEEGQPLLPTRFVGFSSQHAVHGEMCPNLAQKFDVVELPQPIAVVDHQRLALRKIDETRDLLLEAVAVVLDIRVCQHPAHVRAPRRIADRSRAAAHETHGTMPGTLHVRHRHESEEMSNMKTVCRRVEPCVEGHALFAEQFAHAFFICALSDETALFQNIKNICQRTLPFFSHPSKHINPCPWKRLHLAQVLHLARGAKAAARAGNRTAVRRLP